MPLQLILSLILHVGMGQVIEIEALVDTGAQANLINEELIPQGCNEWAREQLTLVAANGLSIPRGNYEVHTSLSLQKFTRE